MALPHAIRAPLVPIGRWINPNHITRAEPGPGPDTVPGVRDLRALGFLPLEEHTGAGWVAQLWPEQDRRSVPETRPSWLNDFDSDARLWLLRSPWPSLTLGDSLNVLWTWAERDHPHPPNINIDVHRERVAEALTWDEATANEWLRRSGR
jgi:hypothetical protein